MSGVCFQPRVKSGHLEAYREAHAAVCPEMLEAFRETAWRIHSIFAPSDGLVIGYFETKHLQSNHDGMTAHPLQRPLAGRND
jgi:L-rhamnose mutarotase